MHQPCYIVYYLYFETNFQNTINFLFSTKKYIPLLTRNQNGQRLKKNTLKMQMK